MGNTISEKILARAAGRPVEPGETVLCRVDLALMPDTTPRRIKDHMESLGAQVWDRDRVLLVMDHFCPPNDVTEAGYERLAWEWAGSHGIHRHRFEGVCHIVAAEQGYVVPGAFIVGADSHTCTAGGLGAFAFGMGAIDTLGVLVTGETWLPVPETIAVEWEGILPVGVGAKDMSLALLARLGMDGAGERVLEHRGSAVAHLNVEERLTLANMAADSGATTAIVEPDAVTEAYLSGRSRWPYVPLVSDPDASYAERLVFAGDELTPLVACPHRLDQVSPASELGNVRIDQAYLGSCTGAKYHDLALAARILAGRHVAPGVAVIASPATGQVLQRIEADGTLRTLLDAGILLATPGCGACAGHRDGILGPGEVCISSTNRNFQGRMGSPQSLVYVASTLTVAASAIAGRIADPREFM